MTYSNSLISIAPVTCLLCFSSVAAAAEPEEDPTPVLPDEETPSPEPDAAADTDEAAVVHHGSVFVDPLGFLLFGPSIAAEVGLGNFSVQGSFRWFSPGLLSNALFVDDQSKFGMSYGLALHGQYFFSGGLSGPHVGLAAEFLHTRIEDESAQIATLSSYIVPQLEGGYRLGFERWFVGATGALGYAARISSSVENLPGGTNADSYTVSNESSPYGAIRLDIGVYF